MSDLMTIREVAQILRVDDTTVRRWCANGAIEAYELPKRGKRKTYRIKRSTMNEILGKTS